MNFFFNTEGLVPEDAASLGELYHENSKIHPVSGAKLGRWIGNLMENPLVLRTMSRGIKTYPGTFTIRLDPVDPPAMSLADALKWRRSILSASPGPKFSARPLEKRTVSALLRGACGITQTRKAAVHGLEYVQRLRAYPSGGGLHPIEIYPALQHYRGEEGVYHYNVVGDELERLREPLDAAELGSISSFGELFGHAPLIIFLTAVFPRSYFKYHERGYRFVLLEAGHIAQNLYLQAVALNLAVVAVGGFFDDVVNDLLRIDGVDEAAVYIVVLGHPAEATPHGGSGSEPPDIGAAGGPLA